MCAMIEKLRMCCMEKGTGYDPSALGWRYKPLILTDFNQIFSNTPDVEAVPAKLGGAVRDDRNVLAVARFQRIVGIDVHDRELEMKTGLQTAQARNHVVTEVAVGAAVYRQLNAHSLCARCGCGRIVHLTGRRPGTGCRSSCRHGARAARRSGPCRPVASSA